MRYYWHTELPLEAFKHVGDRRIKPQGGGGGILGAAADVVGGAADAVSDVASGAADVVSDVVGGSADVVSSVTNTVADAASNVVDEAVNVVSKVGDQAVKAVDTVITAAENDPLAFASNVALIATGNAWALPYFNAANAAAHGASLTQIAQTAATSYVAGQAGMAADQGFSNEALNAATRSAASGATNAALRGGDIKTGALTGAINNGLNTELSSLVNAPTTSGGLPTGSSADTQNQPATDASYRYTPLSDDYSVNADYGLHGKGLGLSAELAPTEVPNDGSSVDYGLSLKDDTGEGLMPSSSPNINKMNGAQGLTGTDAGGTYSALGYTPFNASPNLGDPRSFINNPEVLGRAVAPTDTSWNVNVPRVNFAGALGLGAQSQQSTAPSTNADANELLKSKQSSLLTGEDLTGNSTGDPFYLQKLRQLYSSLTPEMRNVLATNNGQKEAQDQSGIIAMATGGSAESSSTESVFPLAKTGLINPFIGGGQRKPVQMSPLQQLRQGIGSRMAKGGLSISHEDIPKGHKPEFITGHTGYYANGRGTGQSDDIPAMLQHGDFVVDADTVAALGDGSSKAGAQALEKLRASIPAHHAEGGKAIPAQIADGEYVLPAAFVTALGGGNNAQGAKMLDKMREEIRAQKRSAPTSKIPPKAKSPLEYLKMAQKG